MKKALITGITGQDGSYLSELLLSKDYEVYGLVRVSSQNNLSRINHLSDNPNLHLKYGNIVDSGLLCNLIQEINPDEIYNLAALSDVKASFNSPIYATEVNAVGTLNLLEAIRISKNSEKTKFYQASTSELFGNNNVEIQEETSPFIPQSPYACSKLYAYWITRIYRKAYNIFASNGILFNHESKRRGVDFVTRKISIGACSIKLGLKKKLYLGNLSAKRDWGHAKDYVNGMWKIMQHNRADDFILATGITTSVREFCRKVFNKLDIPLEFKGDGIEEKGYNIKTGECVIEIDKASYRPIDVNYLRGNYAKAKKMLNWEPEYSLDDIIDEMVEADIISLKGNL